MTTAAPTPPPRGQPARVHPTALVDGDVTLGEDVVIGPYCVLSGRVRIGPGTAVLPHCVIEGTTTIGRDGRIGPHAAVGVRPAHRAYDGADTHLVLGDRVDVREFTSLHRAASPGEANATRIGNDCLLMATAHVGHDCVVGNHVTMANGVMLGGHVTVGDNVVIGGGVEVHQFCRIGRLAMVGGGETVIRDVLPFGTFRDGGHRAYNAVGVRRFGFDADARREIRRLFVRMQESRSYVQAARQLRTEGWERHPAVVREMVEFIEGSKRGIHPHAGGEDDGAGGE